MATVKMIQGMASNVDPHNVGDIVTVSEEVSTAWIEAGIAEAYTPKKSTKKAAKKKAV